MHSHIAEDIEVVEAASVAAVVSRWLGKRRAWKKRIVELIIDFYVPSRWLGRIPKL